AQVTERGRPGIVLGERLRHVRLEQLGLILLWKQGRSMQIPVRAVEGQVAQEVSALHAFGHQAPDAAQRMPQQTWQPVPGSLLSLDDVLVVPGKDLVAT